jgi:hypothetical protein
MPIGIMTVDTIQGQSYKRPLKVSFDSGSTLTMINPRTLPDGITPHKLERTIALQTGGGAVKSPYEVKVRKLLFPELSPTRCYTNEVEAIVHPHTSRHDVLLGINVMVPMGIDLSSSTRTVQWGELSVPWCTAQMLMDQSHNQIAREVMETMSDALDFNDDLDCFTILASKYQQVETETIAQQQKHLSQEQRDELADVLRQFTTLFKWQVGVLPKTEGSPGGN